jgi:hypothetical protein
MLISVQKLSLNPVICENGTYVWSYDIELRYMINRSGFHNLESGYSSIQYYEVTGRLSVINVDGKWLVDDATPFEYGRLISKNR